MSSSRLSVGLIWIFYRRENDIPFVQILRKQRGQRKLNLLFKWILVSSVNGDLSRWRTFGGLKRQYVYSGGHWMQAKILSEFISLRHVDSGFLKQTMRSQPLVVWERFLWDLMVEIIKSLMHPQIRNSFGNLC